MGTVQKRRAGPAMDGCTHNLWWVSHNQRFWFRFVSVGCLSSMDDGIGQVLGALYLAGKLDNTIVVFSSDVNNILLMLGRANFVDA